MVSFYKKTKIETSPNGTVGDSEIRQSPVLYGSNKDCSAFFCIFYYSLEQPILKCHDFSS